MKKLTSLLLTFCILLTVFSQTPIVLTSVSAASAIIKNDKSGIPDKRLYKAILRRLGNQYPSKKGNKTFTIAEAEKVTYIQAKDVSDFSGIHYLKNLSSISIIAKNKLVNYKKLKDLKNLESIYFSSKLAKKLVKLKDVTQIKKLTINCINLKNLEGIENFTKLKSIRFFANDKIKNFKGCEKLKNLERIELENSPLKSLKGLENCKNLKYLYLDNNKLKNLNPLKNLKKLIYVYANENRLEDISGVKNSKNLKIIQVHHNQLEKLPDLTKHNKLKYYDNILKYWENPDDDIDEGDCGEGCNFLYNKLSKKELKKKLPAYYAENEEWLDTTAFFQNVIENIKLTSPKKFKNIKPTTTMITGVTHRHATLELGFFKEVNSFGEGVGRNVIYTTTSDKNGNFKFENLDLSLEEYKYKMFYINAYTNYDGYDYHLAIKSFYLSSAT